MSRSADIDFSFHGPVVVSNVLSRFSLSGFDLSPAGKISYVVDQDGMFEWNRTECGKLHDILSLSDSADPIETTFGISVMLSPQGVGGDFLFHPGRDSLSFMAEINRVTLPVSKFCDFGWYLHVLVPILEPFGLNRIEASDY